MKVGFDANDPDAIVCAHSTAGFLVGSFTVDPGPHVWGALELTVVYRNGQGAWTTYPGLAVIDASTPSSGRIDVSWVAEVALKITTVDGTSREYSAEFYGR